MSSLTLSAAKHSHTRCTWGALTADDARKTALSTAGGAPAPAPLLCSGNRRPTSTPTILLLLLLLLPPVSELLPWLPLTVALLELPAAGVTRDVLSWAGSRAAMYAAAWLLLLLLFGMLLLLLPPLLL
jgi:hypothetical protein